MFDKLEDLVDRLDTLNNQLTDPDIVSDQNKFRKLMKAASYTHLTLPTTPYV